MAQNKCKSENKMPTTAVYSTLNSTFTFAGLLLNQPGMYKVATVKDEK